MRHSSHSISDTVAQSLWTGLIVHPQRCPATPLPRSELSYPRTSPHGSFGVSVICGDGRPLASGTRRPPAAERPVEPSSAAPSDRSSATVTRVVTVDIRSAAGASSARSAVRIGPDMRLAVFSSPAYVSKRPPPKSPRELGEHECIGVCRAGRGNFYAWEFEPTGRPLKARPERRLVLNSGSLVIEAAPAGLRLSMLLEWRIEDEQRIGRWVQVLGGRRFPDITSTIRAGASSLRPSHSLSMRCAGKAHPEGMAPPPPARAGHRSRPLELSKPHMIMRSCD